MANFYAHSGLLADLSDGQLLRDHLVQVAELARERARAACPDDAGLADATSVAGLLHDLGKYRQEFQRLLKNLPVARELTYHKQAGAAKAFDARNWAVAIVIAGHHGGIPDGAAVKDMAADPKSGRSVAAGVWLDATSDCRALASLSLSPLQPPDKLTADLLTRVMFSCLVDSDWTDTGAHEDKINKRLPPPAPPILDASARLERVLAHVASCAATCKEPLMAKVRDDVLRACLAASERAPGLFTLTVPTGGGKTLSALSFALKHASAQGLRRIIYVAPYLSILDQNARVVRQALGVERDDPAVFEHHSLAEPPGDEDTNETARAAAARCAENWDAPVILTTNVQFFESLFSNKPGRCRKLHNIARSVILLDECQTLPPELVAPTCSMLGQLASRLGCTVVLCTATQPAFDHADMAERLQNVTEIAPPELDLFARLRRVRVVWPKRADAPLDWSEVAGRMRAARAALCVVNTRRAARELFAALGPGSDSFHLSTSMCPAHRLAKLDEVKRRLKNQERCFLVSTQLIEAGVDVDFPIVMRELAPLEAIIQAAGRCNREGLIKGADGSPGGQVEVFRSAAAVAEPTKYYPPDRWYKAGRSVLETSFLNAEREPRIDSPNDIKEYFERLYRTGELDALRIQDARQRYAFNEVAGAYRLIDDDGEAVVVATWKEREVEVAALLNKVRHNPTRTNFRKLAPFQVNLRRHELAKAVGAVGEELPGLFVWRGGYDEALGLTADNADALLIV